MLRKVIAAGVAASIVLVAAPSPAFADKTRDAQWQLGYLKISEAHKITKGSGVTVAVIDTGVDAQHPDLKGSILPGSNLTILKEGSPVGWTDEDGHGTAMAGLIAAHGRGEAGALGIAPESKVLPIRLMARRSERSSGIDEALQFAAARGAKVVSMSFVDVDASPIEQEAVEAARAADLVLVAGVGNRPEQTAIGYPAGYSGVIAVGAIGRNGSHAAFSLEGEVVTLTAPGADITSTGIKGESPGGYSTTSGTSNSTAIVAGAAALVRAKFPQLKADQVVDLLTSTAIDKGPKGRDDEYGYGIVNVLGALTSTVEPPKAPSSVPPPASASDDSSHGDGLSTAVLAMIGGGVLLVIALIAIMVMMRSRRPAV